MDVIRIIAIAIIGCILAIYLKSMNSEYTTLIVISTGIILLLLILDYIFTTVKFFTELSYKSGIPEGLFLIVIKITLISYIADFASGLCEDFEFKSIGNKVQIASRIIIFVQSIPVFETLIEAVCKFVI